MISVKDFFEMLEDDRAQYLGKSDVSQISKKNKNFPLGKKGKLEPHKVFGDL